MFIGVYLAVCAFTTTLILLRKSTSWQRRYLLLSGFLAAVFLFAFLALFSRAGIITFGEPASLSLPGDYLAHGPAGWLALTIGGLGLLSPLLAARLATRMNHSE